MTKRLFVSADYSKLRDTRLRDKIAGLDCFEKETICHWDSSAKCVIKDVDENANVFFFADYFKAEDFIERIEINKEEDFLLWHSGKTDPSIVGLFDKAKIKEGHHGGINNTREDYKYYAIVLQTLLDNEVEAKQKANAVIRKIWPDLEAREELPFLVHQRIGISEENGILEFVEKLNKYYNSYPKNDKTAQP